MAAADAIRGAYGAAVSGTQSECGELCPTRDRDAASCAGTDEDLPDPSLLPGLTRWSNPHQGCTPVACVCHSDLGQDQLAKFGGHAVVGDLAHILPVEFGDITAGVANCSNRFATYI